MIIPLNEKLRIKGKKLDWQVQRKKPSKKGSGWESFLYFPHLAQALKEMAWREVRLSEGEGLSHAIATMEEVATRYEKCLDDAMAAAMSQLEAKSSRSWGPHAGKATKTDSEDLTLGSSDHHRSPDVATDVN